MATPKSTTTVPTLVYSYGAKPPTENAALVDEQIQLAHRYYNRLVELSRQQFADCERVRCQLRPDIEESAAAASAAAEAVEEVIDAIRKRNQVERRKRATPAEQADLAACKELRATTWAIRKEVRAEAATDPVLQAALAEVFVEYQGTLIPGKDRRKGGHFKDARAACGISYGTYLEVEKSVEAARRMAKGPVRFKRWSGDGLVAVQIQGGITTAVTMAGTDQRFRVGAPQPRGKRAPLATVSLRVGSDGRMPVWCQVPVYLHRPLPENAIIMGAALVRRQVAMRRKRDPNNPLGRWCPYYEWSLNVTLRANITKPMATDGACGIDMGWRPMPGDYLRVGYLVGSDGHAEEIRIAAPLLARWKKCDDLRSIRAKNFDWIRDILRAWMDEAPSVPPWLREMTSFMHLWRDKGKLVRVLTHWTANRIENDEAMYKAICRWHEHDVHLWQWERHNLNKAMRARKDYYRSLAARLRMRYRGIFVEDCDWRRLARLPDAGSNESVNAMARYLQRIASVGMLRQCLKSAGCTLVDAAETTTTCYLCGHVNAWEDRTPLILTCQKCGDSWDQDKNAAHILLARGSDMESGGGADSQEPPAGPNDSSGDRPGGSRSAESAGDEEDAPDLGKGSGRWQRRKSSRSQQDRQNKAG